jgi:kynureninase
MHRNDTLEYAQQLDHNDDLLGYRDRFFIPKDKEGHDVIYMCGNSLGLMPKSSKSYINEVLSDWQNLAVEGHFFAKDPWISYHDHLAGPMSKIVGSKPGEIVIMNTLTVNIHLLMVSFYKPDQKRNKILFDFNPFPSDRYAIESQIKFHGIDPTDAMIELKPEKGEFIVSQDKIENTIAEYGDQIALILIGGINYYSGQLYDIKSITKAGHKHGCIVGFDLAHAAGNVVLNLHDDGPDFAAWCTYKYLNSGPGNLSGVFIHERHHHNDGLPRFTGWYGNDMKTRFLMEPKFQPVPTAEGWQVSNQPVIGFASIRASLDIFAEVGMPILRKKSEMLTAYLEFLISIIPGSHLRVITPKEAQNRGSQLSLQMVKPDKALFRYLMDHGVVLDWREPDVLRVAPTPLYNTFEDVWHFHRILKDGLNHIFSNA